MLYKLGKLTVYCFLKLFFNVELEGRDVFPPQGPFILASNHPSYFDPPLLATVVKRRVWFLAKEELFGNWMARAFFRDLGAIPVKRNTSDFRAMRQSLAILKEKPLLVFPQGLVGAPWEQANEGIGFLAKKSGVPIIAARIYGSEHVLPINQRRSNKEKIRVIFRRVDTIKPYDTRSEIANKVMAEIKSLGDYENTICVSPV